MLTSIKRWYRSVTRLRWIFFYERFAFHVRTIRCNRMRFEEYITRHCVGCAWEKRSGILDYPFAISYGGRGRRIERIPPHFLWLEKFHEDWIERIVQVCRIEVTVIWMRRLAVRKIRRHRQRWKAAGHRYVRAARNDGVRICILAVQIITDLRFTSRSVFIIWMFLHVHRT